MQKTRLRLQWKAAHFYNHLHAGLFMMHAFCEILSSTEFLVFKINIFKNLLVIPLMSDQDRGFVRPDLSPNFFSRRHLQPKLQA